MKGNKMVEDYDYSYNSTNYLMDEYAVSKELWYKLVNGDNPWYVVRHHAIQEELIRRGLIPA
jgi:hypothetical protein